LTGSKGNARNAARESVGAEAGKRITFRVFRVAEGWCGAARSRKGYCAFVLPMKSADQAEAHVLRDAPEGRKSSRRFRDLEGLVERYYNGWRTDFTRLSYDLSAGMAFQRKVWEIVLAVPYGQVRTYGWIGMEMGRPEAARAIGAAVGVNPLPLLIPCHRIIAADGALGGYSGPGGVETKRHLLELERVRLFGRGNDIRVLA